MENIRNRRKETGYLNAEEVLNTACNELYGKGQYAESARSLNVEDVNKLANYDPETYTGYGDLWKYRFSTEADCMQSSTSTDNGQTWSDWENITDEQYQTFRIPGSTDTISVDNPKESQEIKYTNYVYIIESHITDTEIANMITVRRTGKYWLASRMVFCDSDYTTFSVRYIYMGRERYGSFYCSNGDSYSPSWSVRPVVSLKSNIQLEGNSEDGWTIK